MKNIENHDNNDSHTLQGEIPDNLKAIVDQVFRQLSVIFPAWRFAWKGETDQETLDNVNRAKKEWTKTFFENQINTVEQIKAGLVVARRSESDFLPSCGKFIGWCKPQLKDLNIPSFEKTYQAAIKNNWFHPIVSEIYQRIGYWDMEHQTDQELRRRFKIIYNEICESISSGEFEFKKPAPKSAQIEHTSKQKNEPTMTPEESFRKMRELLN